MYTRLCLLRLASLIMFGGREEVGKSSYEVVADREVYIILLTRSACRQRRLHVNVIMPHPRRPCCEVAACFLYRYCYFQDTKGVDCVGVKPMEC